MSLKTERGLGYWFDNLWYKLQENIRYSDIQDVERGIGILKKGGFWSNIYLIDCHSCYGRNMHIKLLELIKKQQKEELELFKKHRVEIHDFNVKLAVEEKLEKLCFMGL